MSADLRELFEVAHIRDVTVVRFSHRTILDPATIEAIGDRLVTLVGDGCRKLALDFGRVESLTSGMIGKFASVHSSIEADGGRLVFCAVGPFLRQIFTVCNLQGTIPIYADEAAAVQALSV